MFDTPSPDRNKNDIYDEAASAWWSDEKKWVRTLKKLVPGRFKHFDKLVAFEGKTVLDLGCAGGFMAEALTKRGAMVTGLDPSAPAIAAATDHAKAENLKIEYSVGVGEEIPHPAASFDIVVCVDVLEHVSDLSQVISEIARVLKPGGTFLFDTINRNPLAAFLTVTIAEDTLGLLPKGAHDPALYIKPGELNALLRANGFYPGPLKGLGPRGIDTNFDFNFGPVPTTAVIYMGSATLENKKEHGTGNVGA